MRERIVGMVLATDFSEHFKIMNSFKRTLERGALPDMEGGAGPAAVSRTRKEASSAGGRKEASRRAAAPVFSSSALTRCRRWRR